jgi:hypothetical protein
MKYEELVNNYYYSDLIWSERLQERQCFAYVYNVRVNCFVPSLSTTQPCNVTGVLLFRYNCMETAVSFWDYS